MYFKVGDRVEIENNGKQYTTYPDFYNRNKTEDMLPYILHECVDNGSVGEIMYIGIHKNEHTTLAIINLENRATIMDVMGLSIAEDKEIEEIICGQKRKESSKVSKIQPRRITENKKPIEIIEEPIKEVVKEVKKEIKVGLEKDEILSKLNNAKIVREVRYFMETEFGKIDITKEILKIIN